MLKTDLIRIGVTGHQDVPENALPFIQAEVEYFFFEHNKVECVTSLAVGADQLLAESTLEHGGKIHAVIPCYNYEKTFREQDALKKYNYYLSKASIIERLDFSEPSEEAFYCAGCRVADLSEKLIAIWDGKKANGKGGTADIVEYAKSKGKTVVILWPEGLSR